MNGCRLSMSAKAQGVRLGTALAVLCGAVVPGLAAADDRVLDTLQLHGFLSQGWVTTDHNNFWLFAF